MDRVRLSRSLLESFRLHEDTEFKGMATWDESWFYHRRQENSMHASSHEKVPLMVGHTIRTSKVVITGFFGRDGLICVSAPDPNETLTQDRLVNFALSDLKKPAQNLRRRQHPIQLTVHIDYSRCCNGQDIVDKMRLNHMTRLDHPPYSPDLSPCHV
jgi:histone-lysine N-methyltransferase SETMAR